MARLSEDRRTDEQKRFKLECLRMEEEKERHKEQIAMAEQHQIFEKERAAREREEHERRMKKEEESREQRESEKRKEEREYRRLRETRKDKLQGLGNVQLGKDLSLFLSLRELWENVVRIRHFGLMNFTPNCLIPCALG